RRLEPVQAAETGRERAGRGSEACASAAASSAPAPSGAGTRQPRVRRASPPAADRGRATGSAQARAAEDRPEQRRPQRSVSLRQRREVQEVPREEPLKDSSAPIPSLLDGAATP